eukprot:8013247-Prorocentrum_lima.AAC.1
MKGVTGHVHMSIQKILGTDAICVEAHNTLQRIAPSQGLILRSHHISTRPEGSGHRSRERGYVDKIPG